MTDKVQIAEVETRQALLDENARLRERITELERELKIVAKICPRCGENVGDGDVDGCRDPDCPEAK